MRLLPIIALALIAGCRDESIVVDPLPSGLNPTQVVTIYAPQPTGEIWLIMHIVIPDLAEIEMSAEEIAANTDAICDAWLDYAEEAPHGSPDQIVVHLSSELVERGQRAPDVRQYFAGYRYENDRCIWEDF